MQKIIFFTPIPETGKLASIISDNTPEELIEMDIIPSDSKYLIQDFDESDDDQRATIYHINYMTFDNSVNPKNLVLNKELLVTAVLEDVRTRRVDHLEVLDSLQFRATNMGKTTVAEEIEQDKVKLRNLPSKIDFSDRNTVRKIYSAIPPELFIDYKTKYESKLKSN